MAKKKNKTEKQSKKKDKPSKLEKRVNKFAEKLPFDDKVLINRFLSECDIDNDKKVTHFLNQLPGGDKVLIHRFMAVCKGEKVEDKPVSGFLQMRRGSGYAVNRKVEKRYANTEPIAPGFADSDNQPDNQPAQPEPTRREPVYVEPEPIQIDEKLLEEFREEIEEYFNH